MGEVTGEDADAVGGEDHAEQEGGREFLFGDGIVEGEEVDECVGEGEEEKEEREGDAGGSDDAAFSLQNDAAVQGDDEQEVGERAMRESGEEDEESGEEGVVSDAEVGEEVEVFLPQHEDGDDGCKEKDFDDAAEEESGFVIDDGDASAQEPQKAMEQDEECVEASNEGDVFERIEDGIGTG